MEQLATIVKKMMPKNMIDFINQHKLPKNEYKRLIYQTEISDNEFNLIHAYEVSKCIEELKRLKASGELAVAQWIIEEVIEAHSWIKSWVDDGFAGIDKAIEHLRAVNNWHTKNPIPATNEEPAKFEPYWHACWLFGWAGEMKNRIILYYKLGSREEIKALKDKTKEKSKITKKFGYYTED